MRKPLPCLQMYACSSACILLWFLAKSLKLSAINAKILWIWPNTRYKNSGGCSKMCIECYVIFIKHLFPFFPKPKCTFKHLFCSLLFLPSPVAVSIKLKTCAGPLRRLLTRLYRILSIYWRRTASSSQMPSVIR